MTTPPRVRRKPLVLGPGTLTIGEVGSSLDMSCQLTNVVVTWSAEAEDDVPTLCGDVMPGDRVYTAALTGNVIQDLDPDGVIDWTWNNRGEEVPISFTPLNDLATRHVTGTIIVDPLDLGGDVNVRATSEFEWSFVQLPQLHMDDDDTEPIEP